MPRWTTSYPLPIGSIVNPVDDYSTENIVHPVIIRNQIWILNFLHDQFIEVIIWGSETRRVPFHPVTHIRLISVCSSADIIYIWSEYESEQYVLHKMDTTTMELEEIIEIQTDMHLATPCVIGNTMYVLDGENEPIFHIIDLSTKTLQSFFVDLEVKERMYLTVHDDKCYLLTRDANGKRIVYLVKEENGKSEVLMEDYEEEGWCAISDFENGNMFYRQIDDRQDYLVLQQFDFPTKKWITSYIEKPWRYHHVAEIQAVLDMDDYLVVLLNRRLVKYLEVQLHILEKSPKLSHICLLNMADTCVQQHEDIDQVKNQLPTELSDKLDNMVTWKKREKASIKNGKLRDKQKKRIRDEVRKMETDGTIEKKLAKELKYWFKK